MAIKKFKAAVIGCGNIGANVSNYRRAVQPGTHAGAYQANPKTELVALVETDKKKFSKLANDFPKAKIFSDMETMLKEIKPEIVSIATPAAFHCHNVLLAAKYKCPAILCEKPVAYSVKEARQMISVCRENGSQLFINHQRHFDPLLQKWSKKISAGFLGEIYQGNLYYYNGLFNNGTHWIDLLLMFLGEPASVVGFYNKITSTNQSDLNIDGLIKFKNGSVVSLQSLSKNYGYFNLKMVGEKGMLNIANLGFEAQYRKKINNKNYPGFFELADNTLREGKPRSMISSTIKHITAYLQKGIKPISTGEDGLVVLQILTALKNSADNQGKEVYLKKLFYGGTK